MDRRWLYAASAVAALLGVLLSVDVATDRGVVIVERRLVPLLDRNAIDGLTVAAPQGDTRLSRRDDGHWWIEGGASSSASVRASEIVVAAALDELQYLRAHRRRPRSDLPDGPRRIEILSNDRIVVSLVTVGEVDRGYQWLRESPSGRESLVAVSALDTMMRPPGDFVVERAIELDAAELTGLEVHLANGASLVAAGKPLQFSLRAGGRARLASEVAVAIMRALGGLVVSAPIGDGGAVRPGQERLRLRVLGGVSPQSLTAGGPCPGDRAGVVVDASVGRVCVEQSAIDQIVAAVEVAEDDRIEPPVRPTVAGLASISLAVGDQTWKLVRSGAGFSLQSGRADVGEGAPEAGVAAAESVEAADVGAFVAAVAALCQGPWQPAASADLGAAATLVLTREGITDTLTFVFANGAALLRRNDEPIARRLSPRAVAELVGLIGGLGSREVIRQEPMALASYRVERTDGRARQLPARGQPLVEAVRGELLDEWEHRGLIPLPMAEVRVVIATLRATAIVGGPWSPPGDRPGDRETYRILARFDAPPLPGAKGETVDLELSRDQRGCMARRGGSTRVFALDPGDCDALVGASGQ